MENRLRNYADIILQLNFEIVTRYNFLIYYSHTLLVTRSLSAHLKNSAQSIPVHSTAPCQSIPLFKIYKQNRTKRYRILDSCHFILESVVISEGYMETVGYLNQEEYRP